MTMKITLNNTSIGRTQDFLFQDFLKYCRDNRLVASGESVLIAVSGGLDSSVLAYLMAKCSKILGIKVHLAHVDHRTRGETSRQEAEWVKALGARLYTPVHCLSVPEGIQMNQNEFRNHRRRLLVELANVLGVQKIATAHHADDNAETFLMRAISGTGINGLRGMSPTDGVWIKPLLKFSKEELLNYARSNRLSWIEDPSNSRGQYLRNRIRNEFFPLLEEIRQSSVANLSTVAQRLWEEEAEMDAWLGSQFDESTHRMLSVGWLEKWPRSLKRRIFRMWLVKNKLEAHPALIEDLLDEKEVIHSQGVILKHSDHWVFYPESGFGLKWSATIDLNLNRRSFLGSSLAWSFLPKSPAKFKVYDLSIYLCQRKPDSREDLKNCLNWEFLPQDLIVRSIRREDPREAHDYLSSVRLPQPFRRAWPVLSSRKRPEEVFAVIGIGVLDSYRYVGKGSCLVLENFFEEALV
jgi:tRNA(Ile)-lysidine synthetase-like protein